MIQDVDYLKRLFWLDGMNCYRLPMNYAALFLSFVICSVIMVTWRDPKNADGTSNTGR